MSLRSKAYDTFWEARERLARALATAAHRLDPDISVDIYRLQACEAICCELWHNPDLTGRDVRGSIYAAMY
jgi:hypothetical protein